LYLTAFILDASGVKTMTGVALEYNDVGFSQIESECLDAVEVTS